MKMESIMELIELTSRNISLKKTPLLVRPDFKKATILRFINFV